MADLPQADFGDPADTQTNIVKAPPGTVQDLPAGDFVAADIADAHAKAKALPKTNRDEGFWSNAETGLKNFASDTAMAAKQMGQRYAAATGGMGSSLDTSNLGSSQQSMVPGVAPAAVVAQANSNLTNLNAQQSAVAAQRKASGPQTFAGEAGRAVGYGTGALGAGALIPGEGLVASVATGLGLGAATPTDTEHPSALANTASGAAGGAVGFGMAKAAGRLASPVTNRLTPMANAWVDYLKAHGVPLDLAQQTGSNVAGFMKRLVQDHPLLNQPLKAEQSDAFTKAALEVSGTKGETAATPDVMQSTRGRISNDIKGVVDNIPAIPLADKGSPVLTDLAEISDKVKAYVPDPAQAQTINNSIDMILKAADGSGNINALQYQNLRQSLADTAKGAAPAVQDHLNTMIDSLDEAVQKVIPKEDFDKFMNSRDQWKAMNQIAKSIGSDNKIAPAKLFGTMSTRTNQSQRVFGQGDQKLVQLAQAGVNVLGKAEPNSFTTKRALGYAMTSSLGAAVGGGDATLEGGDKTTGALAGAAAGFALPYAARSIVFNPKVANWLAQRATPASEGFLQRAAKKAGGETGGFLGAHPALAKAVHGFTGGIGSIFEGRRKTGEDLGDAANEGMDDVDKSGADEGNGGNEEP